MKRRPVPSEPGQLAQWEVPLMVGALLIAGLWGFWFMKSAQWDTWRDRDEVEREKAPVWVHSLDEFSGGVSLEDIKRRFSAEGFRMRCYGNLQRNQGLEPSDTQVCWTIAKETWGIPSREITFSFGPEGLRNIRVAFPPEQWPAVHSWFEGQPGVPSGTFGRDQGGNLIVGKMLKTGHVLTAELDHTPHVIVLWQARTRLEQTTCRNAKIGSKQWEALCRKSDG